MNRSTGVHSMAGFAMAVGIAAFAEDKPSADGALPEVILFGDSIRASYHSGVRERLADVARVWSPQENGAHTAHTLKNLDKWLKDHDPAVIHINCGLHDMWLIDAETRRHSLEVYAATMRKVLEHLQAKTSATIILALTTPVNEASQASSGYGRVVRYESDIPRYNRAAAKVAGELGVAIDDLYTPLHQAGAETVLGPDGVHLSKQGVRVAADTVAACIRKSLK